MSITEEIADRTVWSLGHEAGCASPDAKDSPGARFLDRIRNDVLDRIEEVQGDENDASDIAHEIADSAVPIYTYERWQVFADLAAWDEDITELGEPQEDMTANAATALYLIASRLSHLLIEEVRDASDDDDDDDTVGDGDDVEGATTQ